ncbi:uncharacterized protein LOC108109778 [Drosophila eugracilis]|uniref:uncharacterized protein LOC108109778 n=1 Tax=Drosophila eugracilis TaxID=29029 RepID=UPI0007E76622|nr:uncharacterized protein LOC108109778 [Drosophila eugracilis]
MARYNFMSVMEDLAMEFTVGKDQHQLFIYDSRMLSLAIQQQLVKNNAVFKNLLVNLHRTAAYVDNLSLDMPLNFDMFLPIRLPLPVAPSYDEKTRCVRFTTTNNRHPFFFGNAVNSKCMNLLLQRELKEAVSKIRCAASACSGRAYDLKYSVLIFNQVPFVHQVTAMERGSNGQRFIRFDFVLALEFYGEEMTLPPYFDAPIGNRWIAYGKLNADGDPTPEEWAILLPKWQDLSPGACLIALNSMIMLFRLLKAQQCYCYADPASVKFAFVLASEERGLDFQHMSIADFTITTLFHQLFGEMYDAVSTNTKGDKTTKVSRLVALRQQQLRARGIYAMLADAALRNSITYEFVNAYFWYIHIAPPPKCFYKSLIEIRNTDTVLKRKWNTS